MSMIWPRSATGSWCSPASPALSVLPQVLEEITKSPGLSPVKVKPVKVTVTVPVFVTVTLPPSPDAPPKPPTRTSPAGSSGDYCRFIGTG